MANQDYYNFLLTLLHVMSSPSPPPFFFFLTIKYLSLLRNCQPLLKASRLWPLGPRWSESFPVWVRAFHLLHFLMSPKKAVRLSPWCPLETGSFCVGYPLPSLSLTSVLLRDFPGPVSVCPCRPPSPAPAPCRWPLQRLLFGNSC